jgi:filamentous hemagglutinin
MRRNDLRAFIALALIPLLLLPQGAALAEFAIPGFTRPGGPSLAPPLPGARPIESGILPEGVTLDRSRPNHLEVNQSRDKVVIRWESFDIGSDASTHFNQQGNADWVALNRIADTGVPTQIFGRLTADGKLYLVNRNGILFGEGSQVNLHSLLATSIDIDPVNEQALLNGQTIQLRGTGTEGSILNEGTIQTKQGGRVIIVAPQVANAGEIDAQAGAIYLIGSSDASIDTTVVNNSAQGLAVNAGPGRISSDAGFVGLWGDVVRQEGLIRTVTTIQKGGTIQLIGKSRAQTTEGSRTLAPVSDSAQTMHENSPHQRGRITVQADRIEHLGEIIAPSGVVTMTGEGGIAPAERITLGGGSTIDVAGVLYDQEASKAIVSAQLNSSELRDDHRQKGGVLQGTSVKFHTVTGSAIGEVSGDLVKENVTALERNTVGGEVRLTADEIILREGSLLDVSGGAVRYGSGGVAVTKLLSGSTIHSLENASPSLRYDAVLGSYQRVYDRHGVVESRPGFFTGGANSVTNYVGSYVSGKAGGGITLLARRLVLDGTLLAAAFNGRFQTATGESVDAFGYPLTSEKSMATGGFIEIGRGGQAMEADTPLVELLTRRDHLVQGIVIQKETAKLPESFGPDTEFPLEREGVTLLSAGMLNRSGAQRISLFSNTGVRIEQDASITLPRGGVNTQITLPGGVFEVQARDIVLLGSIAAPGGKVSLVSWDTAGSIDTEHTERSFTGYTPGVHLAGESSISVAGQEVDNWTAAARGRELVPSASLNGGEIVLEDLTWYAEEGGLLQGTAIQGRTERQGVIVREGALLDVSAGWMADAAGKVTGGNAGSLTLRGSNLVVDGEIRGHGYLGRRGGQITLHADSLGVIHSDSWSPELDPGFAVGDLLEREPGSAGYVLNDARLADSGFTRINLRSRESVTVDSGARLAPSLVVKTAPRPGPAVSASVIGTGQTLTRPGDLVTVEEHLAGPSSLSIATNRKVTSTDNTVSGVSSSILVRAGAFLAAAPAGSISLAGPAVTVEGSLSAPGGSVAIGASTGDLRLADGASILAAGYLTPHSSPVYPGLELGTTPQTGGRISLTAQLGSVHLELGSTIDISGSPAAANLVRQASGVVGTITEAANPGSIEFVYRSQLQADGLIKAESFRDGLPGAAVRFARTDTANAFALSAETIEAFQARGFDEFSFFSPLRIDLVGATDLAVGRRLTLDAPLIRGDGGAVRLSADWVTLANTTFPTTVGAATGGPGDLAFEAGWIDLDGDVVLQGFGQVSLLARNDIRLFERVYSQAATFRWGGRLAVGQDLTLAADRIHPGKLRLAAGLADMNMYSQFALQAPGGKVTINPGQGNSRGPIYSAGGQISVQARQLEHRGALHAPMGRIDLVVQERLFLAPGSVLSVKGDIPVRYGNLDEGLDIWQVYDRDNPQFARPENFLDVNAVPQKSITLTAGETIVRQGAVVDTSGGGSIYGSRFIGGTSGTVNPFEPPACTGLPARMVVVPGLGFPGNTIVVTQGTGLLPAGTYSPVPDDLRDEYGFLPGAVVLYDLGQDLFSMSRGRAGEGMFTSQGYAVVGASLVQGPGVFSPRPWGYAVRPAEEVALEGEFPRRSITAGGSGDLTLSSPTLIMDGTILSRTMQGFQGGRFSASGAESALVTSRINLGEGFSFLDTVPAELRDSSNIFAGGISGAGMREVSIGQAGLTRTTRVEPGVDLGVDSISLIADALVSIGAGAGVRATAPDGAVNLLSPQGRVSIGEGAEVFAGRDVVIDSSGMDMAGRISVGGSTLKLRSDRIVIADGGMAAPPNGGLVIYDDLRNLEGFKAVELTASQAIELVGEVDLSVPESLLLAAPRITGTSVGHVASGRISLLGTGTVLGDPAGGAGGGAVTFAAGSITLGPNDLLLEGFGDVTLASSGDLILAGRGSLRTAGDLHLVAARVTNAPTLVGEANGALTYTPGNFQVTAGAAAGRSLTLSRSGGTAGTATTPGGALTFSGRDIDVAGFIDLESASLSLRAGNSATVRSGAVVRSTGGEFGPGSVALLAESGNAAFEAGSLVDVSATGAGAAGSISISSPVGMAALDGELRGLSASGPGGSLALDTGTLPSFSFIARALAGSGIDREVSVRVRQGDVAIGLGDTVRTSSFTLSADGSGGIGGSIVIDAGGDGDSPAIVDASGVDGGLVRILAGRDLSFVSGTIDASGARDGGYVLLGSGSGSLSFGTQARVDVSVAGGDGGTAHFRARRTDDNEGIRATLLGDVHGAENALAEGYRVYALDQAAFSIGSAQINGYRSDAQDFFDRVDHPAGYTVVPGIEIRNSGSITLASAWDLTSWNFGTAAGPIPGMLSLRAGNDLTINADLSSRRVGSTGNAAYQQQLQKDPKIDSWGISLAAGSDLGAADFMAVRVRPATATGRNLTVAQNMAVYTESAPLSFASGGDTLINYSQVRSAANSWLTHNTHIGLGTFDGPIRGAVGNTLNLGGGGVILSGTGDISLTAGSAVLSSGGTRGSIVTTGYRDIERTLSGIDPAVVAQHRDLIVQQTHAHWWMYDGGGDISFSVAGSIAGTVDLTRWGQLYNELPLVIAGQPASALPDIFQGPDGVERYWLAKYANPLSPGQPLGAISVRDRTAVGVVAMAGGDVSISAGGDALLQAGTFGMHSDNRLTVSTGGNLDGLFMARRGLAELSALGSYGTTQSVQHRYLETEAAALSLRAMGNIALDGAIDPSLTQANISRYLPGTSSLRVSAAMGDVVLSGRFPGYAGVQLNVPESIARLLPPDVSVSAGRDIRSATLTLAPSRTGNLVLDAGRDITGFFVMADVDPSGFYGLAFPYTDFVQWQILSNRIALGYADLIHAEDPYPVLINAGRDIAGVTLALPKQTRITAGRDIKDFVYTVQNLNPTDVSLLRAGRDIVPTTGTAATSLGVFQYGPGTLIVQAGNDIALGASSGIQSLGNSGTGLGDARPKLPDLGATLLVVAGYDRAFDLAGVRELFLKTEWEGLDATTGEPLWKQKLFEAALESERTGQLAGEADSLQEIGLLFTEYRTVAPETAQRYLGKGRELLAEFYGDSATENPGGGNIRMEKTRIVSRDDGGDIYILARGTVVVGRSNIQLPDASAAPQDSSLGIFTERRGDIKIFAVKDIDVFESRVMSMFGGDIAVWSDTGNVNAGKGSKTQVSAPVNVTGEFRPPAVGSGVRTSTYDPDGPEGPREAPLQGDAYVFAPEGIIDAGEAGISARNIYLGATQIINAQNIQAANVSVGVPVQVSGTAGIGAMSGSSGLADATRMIENTAGMAAARERAEQMARPPQFTTQLLDVRVVNYLE